jgi:phosphate transport system substrate-binding protein
MKTWSLLGKLLVTLLLSVWLGVACQPQKPNEPIMLTGTGATFPFPLYQRWFSEYSKLKPNVQINYQQTGSAVGIQQLISQTTDFGASDVAMSDEEMAQVTGGVVLLPVTGGSVAIAYNLPSLSSPLKLPRSVYPEIFLGKITRWNDGKIVQANPGVKLPDLPITLIHRSDGSGTTATLTAHLSKINPQWQKQVGTGLNVSWPTGIGIKSNAGVSAQILQAEGTMGYVEYSYAQKLNLAIAHLENQAGNFVAPSVETAASALESVEFPENLRAFVPDPAPATAYPLVTYSWLLLYQKSTDRQKSQAIKELVTWALDAGQKYSRELGYVPLPEMVREKVRAALGKVQS